ncbi:DUF3341 domain-containing protein [bacterium]|jgi:hypothetical protein|nr:DUF3341 domain-containing protein [bacterium]MBT7311485.1 DUF3341 domain-containing protein [bacterium]
MKLYGLLAEFDSPHQLVEAVENVRDQGFSKWDVHTPFPIHGMDGAMGIRGSRLPFIVLIGGLTGLVLATLLQWWTNAVDYPFLISGKPMFGLPAAFPVMFELTILLSAFATFFGMWGLNKLPKWHNPLFNNDRFRRATQDRFFIAIEAGDPKFDLEKTREMLMSLGSTAVEEVEE